ncbi:hypothetical protein Vadar_004885 [Vaccinium darrowii]|uniref:Uncharacterized protein n=1 Tax=Vaccinium darrowii TaxID=229202 RepID=A0ACB7XN72_9ERIC|nr:hypothetical protein Vadar_004885 [Vaccinium darrowii]
MADKELMGIYVGNPNHTFVGMWNHKDAKKLLYCSKHELEMGCDLLDLRQHVVSDNGQSLLSASRETIVRECLGVDVDFAMWVGRSDWDDYDLHDDQILYASVDAYCSFLIGKDLRAWEL